MTISVMLVLLLTLIARINGQCYSSCEDNQCLSYCIGCCTGCPLGLLEFDGIQCKEIAGVTALSVVDSTWLSLYAPNVNSISDQTLNNYADAVAAGWTTSGINITSANFLTFNLSGIGSHFQMQVRLSIDLSIEPGCLSSSIDLQWNNDPVMASIYYSSIQLSVLSSTQVISAQFPHTLDSDKFKVTLGATSPTACTYFTLRDVSFITQLCSSACRTCSATYYCTSCPITQLNQMFLISTLGVCNSSCTLSYVINPGLELFVCNQCDFACQNCSMPFDPNSCYSCNNMAGFYLVYNTTTQCTFGCPIGQFIDFILMVCDLCDSNCRTCQNTKLYCTTCGINSNGTQTYLSLLNYTCITVCLKNYYMDGATAFECDQCHMACIQCSAVNSNSSCISCNNMKGYYFSYNSTSNCVLGCQKSQFISGNPLTCTPCDINCRTCTNTSYSCSSCGASTTGQLYLAPNQTCVSTCPDNYYPMVTANLCSKCLPACLECSGYSLSLCTSCGNVTSAGVITIYYYQQGTTVCSTTCPSGQFIDINVPNICQKCAIACVTCSITSNNCTGDICASGLYYFNSTCITTCPQGTFGDSNMKCSACEYFLFDGQCIEQCPSGYLGVIGTISTCSPCSDSTCSTQVKKTFALTSKVTNENSFQHQIVLSEGLSSNSTVATLKDGLKVVITSGERRLLLSTTTLTVQGLSISTNNMYIYILTNLIPVSLASSSVSVSFRAGALVTASGASYNQLTSSVTLSSSTSFIKSYYQVFGSFIYQQAEGIVFVLLSFLLLLTAIFWLRELKFEHQCMSLVQMVQIIGLSKMRELPFQFDFYNVLIGYSHFDLRFIPNKFADIFASAGYSETTIDSAAFDMGSQNFIVNFGSLFYIYLPFQITLLIFFVVYRNNEPTFAFLKNVQEHLINFWSVIVLFGSLLCLLSVQNNEITSSNMYYAITILISFVIVGGFGLYFGMSVRDHLRTELYKVNNVVRVIGLLMLAHGQKASLLVINFSQILFIALDFSLYRHHKISPFLYFLERILFLIVFNSSLIEVSFNALMAIAGVCFGLIILIKCFYLVRVVMQKITDPEGEGEREKIQSNASMDFSISDNKVKFNKHQEEIKSAEKDINMNRTLPESKLFSNQTLMEPTNSIIFEENVHRNDYIKQESLNQLRPPMNDPVMDHSSEISEEIQLTVKRRRMRLEPVVVRANGRETQSQEEHVDIIQIQNLTQNEKSEKESDKKSEPEQEIWR